MGGDGSSNVQAICGVLGSWAGMNQSNCCSLGLNRRMGWWHDKVLDGSTFELSESSDDSTRRCRGSWVLIVQDKPFNQLIALSKDEDTTSQTSAVKPGYHEKSFIAGSDEDEESRAVCALICLKISRLLF